MTPEQWQQVVALFDRVMDASPVSREMILSDAGTTDPVIAAEVRRLLANLESASASFLDVPVDGVGRLRERMKGPGLAAGTVLAGRFRVERLLGTGGMGEVYEALDKTLGERVALKVLRAEAVSARNQRRFLQEAQTARKVTHPNVCRIYDVGEDGGISFLTMELLEGETLAAYLKRRAPLRVDEAMGLVEQIGAGLDAAHRAGIVHRDFKPGNVMLVGEGSGRRVVVMDFGLARFLEAGEGGTATETRSIQGTPDYIAPEVLMGEGATARADIFALGVVLFEMMTGERPYAPHLPGLMERVRGKAVSARAVEEGVPEAWEQMIRRCLQVDPERRPASAGEVSAGLRRRVVLPVGNVSRRWALAAGGTVVAGVGLAKWKPWARGFPKAAVGAKIVVADVVNTTGDGDLNVLGDLLRETLLQSMQLNPVGTVAMRRTLARMARPAGHVPGAVEYREMAAREGAGLVLFGTVSRLGKDYVLNLQLERLAGQPDPVAVVHTSLRAATKGGVLEALREGAGWTREQAGESLAGIVQTNRPVQDLTTDSWAALEEFRRSSELMAQRKTEEAVLVLKSAVEKDPLFASAWGRLGDLSNTLHREEDSLRYWQKALGAMKQRPVARREELRMWGLYGYDTGDLAEAQRYFQMWSMEFPHDPLGWFYQCVPLAHMGRTAEALDVLTRTREMVGNASYVPTNFALVHLVQSDGEAALRELGNLGPAPERRSITGKLEAAARWVKGELGGAMAVVEQMVKEKIFIGHYCRGLMLAEAGKHSLAMEAWREGLRQPVRAEEGSVRADMALGVARLATQAGDVRLGRESAEAAMELDAGAWRLANAACTLVWCGEGRLVERARARLAEHPQVHKYRMGLLTVEGEMALQRGDYAEAVDKLGQRAAMQPARWYQDRLAAAEAGKGDARAARRRCERIWQHPGVAWVVQYPVTAGAGYEALQQTVRLSQMLGEAVPEGVRKRLALLDGWNGMAG